MPDTPAVDPLSAPNAVILNRKRRGAPRGNKNAFRHGFYARDLGVISPCKLDEYELRNLMGEVSMIKDYMHILYKKNLASDDADVLTDTLRALSLAGMAVSRLLLTNSRVRITRSSDSTLDDLLADMNSAAARANRLASSSAISLDDDDDDL